jgi:hypothetical protein
MKLKRQRRPAYFLYWTRHRWHRDRSTAIVKLSGRKDAGRPKLTRADDR